MHPPIPSMAGSDLTVLSLNVRGLRSLHKRRNVFHEFKKNKYDVICMQETYITEREGEQWKKEWGGELVFSPHTAHSCGQVILLRKGLVLEEKYEWSTRMIGIKIRVNDMDIIVMNVYAPCPVREKVLFFEQLETVVKGIQNDNVCICGDFNAVLNNHDDVISGQYCEKSIVESFNSFLSTCDLFDIWRMMNPDSREFSWSRRNPFVARRLDYILSTSPLFDKVVHSYLLSVAATDHRACVASLKFTDFTRGPGYYKLNTSLLSDIDYVNQMNELIDTFVPDPEDDHQVVWDMLKIKIKEFSLNYSKEKSLLLRNRLAGLRVELNDADVALAKTPDCRDSLARRERVKMELELYQQHEARAAQVRSRVRWIQEGEKNTKYFLGLEKVRAKEKVMESVKDVTGDIVTGQENVSKVQTEYFKSLYKKKVARDNMSQNIQTFLTNTRTPTLTDVQKKYCDQTLSVQEVTDVLKGLKNGSCPGADGLPVEFYKVFWSRIVKFVLSSFNAAFVAGNMSSSQRKAVITLIHKGKELPRNEMNNWRPISLTNADYKLLAKTLAVRLSSVISDLVAEEQVGYIKGRRVSHILRAIDDVADYLNQQNKPGLLVGIDYFHAFDCISKDYMLEVFNVFGFGEVFTKWVSVLMTDTLSCVNYGGWLSEYFAVESGIRQGCPFSPLAFVLGIELLACKIRNCVNIKGIQLDGNVDISKVIKILLYADDITLFLQDEGDMREALMIFDEFSLISGLYINRKKSEALWLGSRKNCGLKPVDFVWKDKIKILGVYFSNKVCASKIEENWLKRVDNCKRLIAAWEKRNLSIMGKVCIVKTFLISQWVYIMQALLIPENVLIEMNRLLYRFLWRKRDSNRKAFEKVKRTVLCGEVEEGGLVMIDLKDLQTACLLHWAVSVSKHTDELWNIAARQSLSCFGDKCICFHATVRSKVFKGLDNIKSLFWKSVVQTWLDNNDKGVNRSASQLLWNNDVIRHQGNVLFFADWVKGRILTVEDMLDDNGYVLTLDFICEKIGYLPNRILEYNVVCSAVKSFLRRQTEVCDDSNFELLPFCGENVNTIRGLRKMLVDKKNVSPCAVGFWKRKFNFDIIPTTWNMASMCTKEIRLKLLQWKILHNIYATNILLSKMRIVENDKCSYCKNVVDYLEHFFYECPVVHKFWKFIEQYIMIHLSIVLKLDVVMVLFGVFEKNIGKFEKLEINYILLIAKMCISIFKKTQSSFPLEEIFHKHVLMRKK